MGATDVTKGMDEHRVPRRDSRQSIVRPSPAIADLALEFES